MTAARARHVKDASEDGVRNLLAFASRRLEEAELLQSVKIREPSLLQPLEAIDVIRNRSRLASHAERCLYKSLQYFTMMFEVQS